MQNKIELLVRSEEWLSPAFCMFLSDIYRYKRTKIVYKSFTFKYQMNRLIYLCSLTISVMGCPSRESALDCFYKKADRNHDGRISFDELNNAIDQYLPWYKRIPFKTFGGVARIMADCDADGDQFLTKSESVLTKDSCLETCFKRSSTMYIFDCK